MSVAGVLLGVLVPVAVLPAMQFDDQPKGYNVNSDYNVSEGIRTFLNQQQAAALPPNSSGRPAHGNNAAVAANVTRYEYRTQLQCKSSDAPSDGSTCHPNYANCLSIPDAHGPFVSIERREIPPGAGSKPTGWTKIGETCYPDAVPGANAKPQLTLQMIRQAWRQTPFAAPTLSMQPVGNKTLVTLPVFYKINWPAAGFAPAEINTTTLLGHQVRIKPVLANNVITYGDGATSGPVTSTGGTYPNGDLQHQYDKQGTYTVSVATEYGGQFSVDGDDWVTIPGTIRIPGPSQQLEVLTAKNRLVNH